MIARGTRRGLAACAIASFAVAACGGNDRPSAATWAAEWEREQLIAPTTDDLTDGGDRCDELVGRFREVLPRLTPTPNEALDDAVEAWVDHAGNLVFDCPDDAADIEQRLDQLAVLAAEIDAGLAAG